jgi:hypothetical protein
MPMGAGLCVRKEIANAYSQFCGRSSIQMTDRQGVSQYGKGDIEISFVCCSCGFGTGVFPQLIMTHLMPQHRISEDYFVRLAEGTYFSDFLLNYKWRGVIPQSPFGPKMLVSLLKTILRYRGVDRKMRFAWVRALFQANRVIQTDLQLKNRQNREVAGHLSSKDQQEAL